MLHLPQADGTRELLIRACTRCPLAEALHVRHRGGDGRLETHEHWWVEEVLPGWFDTRVLWDQQQEARAWI
jgi:hypothetical protein